MGSMERKSRSSSSNSTASEGGKSKQHYVSGPSCISKLPGILIVITSLYFVVFVLHILDVNYHDSTSLLKAYQGLRAKESESAKSDTDKVQKDFEERKAAAVQTYQGDTISPWDNPFISETTIVGRAKSAKEQALEVKQLKSNLQDSVLEYILKHEQEVKDHMGVPDDVSALLKGESAVVVKLRNRQQLVEESFDKVNAIHMGSSPREYAYKSIFKGPEASALTLPPTVSFAELEQGGFFSSIGNLFSSGKKESTRAQQHQPNQSTDVEDPNEDDNDISDMRSAQAFATLAEKNKPKSASARLLENSLAHTGYKRHRGKPVPLPLWVIAHGRKCPALPASALNASAGSPHALVCAARSLPGLQTSETRQVVPFAALSGLAPKPSAGPAFAELAGAVKAAFGKKARMSWPFFRLYDAKDRAKLGSAQLKNYPSGFLVAQKNGAGSKPQVVKSVASLIENAKYHDEILGIVASPLPAKPRLWRGRNAFALRSWVVFIGGRAFFAQGDAIVSAVPYTAPNLEDKSNKESPDDTLAMRLPSWKLNEVAKAGASAPGAQGALPQVFPATKLGESLKVAQAVADQIASRQRKIATWVALAYLSNDKSSLPSGHSNMIEVQHLCLDFTVSGGMVAELLSVSSDCALTLASSETQQALTTEAMYAAERVMAHNDQQVRGESLVRIVGDDGIPVVSKR